MREKYKTIKTIALLLFLLFFGGNIRIIESDNFLLLSAIFTYFLCIMISKKYNYAFLLVTVVYFIIVTVISDTLFPREADLKVVLGTLVRFFLALNLATLLGYDFYPRYYRFISIMALISLPLYLIQNFYPELFTKQLLPIAKTFSTDLRYDFKQYSYFIHTFHVSTPFRNSGFMWEPGGLGMAVGIALFYGLLKHNFIWNKYNIILLIAGLTTLSTTFYFSLAAILSFYFLNKYRNNIRKAIVLSLTTLVFIYAFNNLPFMGEKIEKYMDSYNKYTMGGNIERMTGVGGQAGRIISFYANWKSFLKYPFGHGDNESYHITNALGEVISGANGLGPFMVRYGIIGLLFLFFSLKKTCNYFHAISSSRALYLFILLIVLYLFSNPMYRNPSFLTLLFIPFTESIKYAKPNQRDLLNENHSTKVD